METIGDKGFDKGKALTKLSYAHDVIIDMILLNPRMTKKAIAETTGYSQGWLCRMIASDAFRARFEARRRELSDSRVKGAINERLKAALIQSTTKLIKKMDETESATIAIETLGLLTRMESNGEPVKK